MTQPWDLLDVGGGTAGLVGAYTGAALGARVALVERGRTGGDCLWTGCVPSKALIAAAAEVAAARSRRPYLSSGPVQVDTAAVLAAIRQVIATIEPVDSPEALRAAGVVVLSGELSFTGPASAVVDGQPHRFAQALLATGAQPRVPEIPGIDGAAPYTSETIWERSDLAGRWAIIGGGPVGCELGQALARLGAQVTLVESSPRLLPLLDPDASRVVRHALEHDGVRVLTGHRAVCVELADDQPRRVVAHDGDSRRSVPFDALLVAVGRRPRVDMGLDRALVRLDPSGAVAVDRYLRTSNPRVWAAGDVTPYPHLTHLAAHHGGIAATNALLGLRRRTGTTPVPRVVYTDPEVAAVGRPTWSPDAARSPRTVTRGHDHVDRAVTDGRTEGFSRLRLDRWGTRITGATIVGPRAGESVAALTLAIDAGMSPAALAATITPYPTYGDGPANAALDAVRHSVAHPAAARALSAAVAVRRQWLRLRHGDVTGGYRPPSRASEG